MYSFVTFSCYFSVKQPDIMPQIFYKDSSIFEIKMPSFMVVPGFSCIARVLYIINLLTVNKSIYLFLHFEGVNKEKSLTLRAGGVWTASTSINLLYM